MIYLGFIFDYVLSLFLPCTSYFLVASLDKNRFLSILVVGVLLDYLYHQFFFFLFLLVSLYFLVRIFHVKKKYAFFKNVVLFFLFFHITYFFFGYTMQTYVRDLFVGFFLQLFYLKLSKVLLK